jgi:hypothetical protein
MAAIVAGAGVGAFGNGLLSRVAASNGAFSVQYPRFFRAHAPLTVSIEWVAPQHEATFWFERSYLEKLQIEEIRPAAAAVASDSARLYYTFPVREPGARIKVDFVLKPERGGTLRGRVGPDGAVEVAIRQFGFP